MKDMVNTLTVDSFFFLWREVVAEFQELNFYRNILALIGAIYVTRKTISLLWLSFRGITTHVTGRLFPVHFTETGDWAVVTGPTEGIGRAFALELAKRGMSIILLGRNPYKLEKLSELITSEYKQQTKVMIIDFSDPEETYEEISNAFETVNIGVVVNNVGTINSYPSYLYDIDDDEITRMLTVNIQSVTKMTKLAISHMRSRKKGYIINVSSISSIAPAPLLQVYAATKAYVTSFSRAVHEEVKADGITVQTLIPSYVKTRMVHYSPLLSTSWFTPTPEVYVRNALRTLRYSSYTTGYWLHGIQACVASSLPDALYMYMIQKANLFFRDNYIHSE